MVAPVEAVDARPDGRQPKPPVIRVAEFAPREHQDTNSLAFVIPGAFLDAYSRTINRYGQIRAEEFGVKTHVLSARLKERNGDPREQQAAEIATNIQKIAEKNGVTKIKLAGDSQGANIALSVYRKLTEISQLEVEELHLRHPRGLTQETSGGIVELLGLDFAATGFDLLRSPIKNASSVPIVTQYLTDMRREIRKAREDGVFGDIVRSCGLLNHDIKFVKPPTKVYFEFGEKDFLLHLKDLFPHYIPGTNDGRLARDLQQRFFPENPEVFVTVVPDARHLNILKPGNPPLTRRTLANQTV